MSESQKEYIVGTVSPTNRPGAARDQNLDDRLPRTVKYINVTMNFTRGTEEEFAASMPGYEAKVAELAALKADLIRPSGAPPFMLLGFEGERRMIRGWEEKYRVPMFTSGQNQVRALRTLGVKRFVGASYFPEELNAVFERYFNEAGFRVLAMEGISVPFDEVPKLPPAQVFDHIQKIFERHPEAEGIYMLGVAWKTLEIIEKLERTLGVPVVHPAAARCWETQLRLGFHQPVPGYGRLLAEMPEAARPV